MIVCIMKHITGSVSTHNTNLGGLPLHYDVVGAISYGKVFSSVLNRPITLCQRNRARTVLLIDGL